MLIRPLPIRHLPHPAALEIALIVWRPLASSEVRPLVGVSVEPGDDRTIVVNATADPVLLDVLEVDAAWLGEAIVDAVKQARDAAECSSCESSTCYLRRPNVVAAVQLDSSKPLNLSLAERIAAHLPREVRTYLKKLGDASPDYRSRVIAPLVAAGGPAARAILDDITEAVERLDR